MLYLASDHAGFALKQSVKEYLAASGQAVKDLGNIKLDESDDYADFAILAGQALQQDVGGKAILICGTGQGMCMVVNKFKGVRGVLGYERGTVIASRTHNNSNALCLPAWQLKPEPAIEIIKAWLETGFSQGERHKKRLEKFAELGS